MKAFLVAIVFVCAASCAVAEDDPLSNANLSQAETEIGTMGEDELRALLHVLTECVDPTTKSETIIYSCETSNEQYVAKFGGNRKIDSALQFQHRLRTALRDFRRLQLRANADETITINNRLTAAVAAALKAKRRR